MLSLFRRDPDQGWLYREAWYDDAANEFVVHHGKVGANGKLTAERAQQDEAEALLESFTAQCGQDGYAEPAAEDLTVLKVLYPLKSAEPSAVERRNANTVHEAALTTLAWRGLGAPTDPAVQRDDDGHALVMRFSTLHRRKAEDAVRAAVRSTDVQPSKVSVRRA